MYSATVVTEKGIDSDIYSTACFVLGKLKAGTFAKTEKINQVFLIFPAEDNSKSYSLFIKN
jgi:thiamine biosynthesis lipoprotein ApbE